MSHERTMKFIQHRTADRRMLASGRTVRPNGEDHSQVFGLLDTRSVSFLLIVQADFPPIQLGFGLAIFNRRAAPPSPWHTIPAEVNSFNGSAK
jgi:hypothetical protein